MLHLKRRIDQLSVYSLEKIGVGFSGNIDKTDSLTLNKEVNRVTHDHKKIYNE